MTSFDLDLDHDHAAAYEMTYDVMKCDIPLMNVDGRTRTQSKVSDSVAKRDESTTGNFCDLE
jgi:hypothetical protein